LSITEILYTDWDAAVSKVEGAVVVEFWHQNCPTCKKIEPTVKGLPGKLGKASLIRLNVLTDRETRKLAIGKGVIGTPTFKVYCRGVEIGEVVGLETLTDLAGTLNNILKDCP
jgi:thiol-disulfide isomerase/thioredoxin